MLDLRAVLGSLLASDRRVAGLSATFSLLLSLLAVATKDLLNRDGMWYVYTAQVFAAEGIGAAFRQFNWPFLSILIGTVHAATGWSCLASAYLLSAGLLAALSAGFVLLYREIGGSRAWVAAAVICLSPFLNEYRGYVIRDFGYWCFGLWAVWFFVRFCRRGRNWTDALGWQACVLAAIAFRIEAVALAALLPLYCACLKQDRLLAWLRSNALFIAGGLVVVALGLLEVIPLSNPQRVQEMLNFLSWSELTRDFHDKVAFVASHLQAAPSDEDARAVLFGGAIGILVRQVVWGLGVLGLPLAAGLWQGRFRQNTWGPLPWAMTAAALPVLVFALRDMFLSNRYPGLLILLLSLPAARMLDAYLPSLAEAWRKHPLRMGAIVAALSLWAVDAVIVTDHGKRYLREAAAWAEANVPVQARFFANVDALYFFSGHDLPPSLPLADTALDDLAREAGQRDWLLLRVLQRNTGAFEAALQSRPGLRVAARFENPKGDAVYALRVEHPASGN